MLDKESDVGNVTSMANSAIVHSGYDPKPGTNKAKYNVEGNSMYDLLTKELDVEFKRIGSLTCATDEEEMKIIEGFVSRAKDNGVEVKILNKENNQYEQIDKNKLYTLASHNYLLLDKGSGASMLNNSKIIVNDGMLDVELLEKYIKENLNGTITEEYLNVQNRILIK